VENRPIKYDSPEPVFQDVAGSPIAVSATDRDLYLNLCNEDWTQMRHHETQRATAATLGFGVSGAIFGLVAKDGFRSSEAFLLGVILAAVAVVAGLVSYKHYERSRLHTERADIYRVAIDSALLRLNDLRRQADTQHRAKHPIFSKDSSPFRLHRLWNGFFTLMAIIGLVIALEGFPAWKAGATYSPKTAVCSCSWK
jgi:hypothetical protein